MSASAFSDRLIPALLRVRPLEPLAARAFWKGLQLLSLAFAHRLSDLRSDAEPLVRAHGEVEETARLFRVLTGTVERWQSEMNRADDDTRTIGKTVRPHPPLRRYAEVVEHLCQTLALAGLSGQRMIASTLARAGYLVSRSTVRRRLRKPVSVPPLTTPDHHRRFPLAGVLETRCKISSMHKRSNHAGALVEKIQGLPPDKLAEVEDFVDFLAQQEDRRLVRGATKLSEKAFKKVWSNPRDAAYDRL